MMETIALFDTLMLFWPIAENGCPSKALATESSLPLSTTNEEPMNQVSQMAGNCIIWQVVGSSGNPLKT